MALGFPQEFSGTVDKYSTAYEAGKAAALAGKTYADNPHRPTYLSELSSSYSAVTAARRNWHAGFKAGEKEQSK